MGAARGHLAGLAPLPHRLAGQASHHRMGLRRNRAQDRGGREGAHHRRRAAEQARARRILARAHANLANVEFFRAPSDRGWSRDFGPICVRKPGPEPEVAIAKFKFTAWAKYPQLAQGQPHRRANRQAAQDAALPGHARGRARRARRRRHRRERLRHPADHGGVLPRPENPVPQPRHEPRGIRPRLSPTPWARPTSSGWATGSRATTPTAMSTICAAS